MKVQVRLYATLRRYTPQYPDGCQAVELPEAATVADAAKQIGIDLAEIHLIMVNGVGTTLERCLQGNDRVGLFPPVGGG